MLARLLGLVAKTQQTRLDRGIPNMREVLSTSQSTVDTAVAWVRADNQVLATYVAIGRVTANAQDLEPVRTAAVAAARAAERLRTAIMSDVPVPGIVARAYGYLRSRLQRRL